MASQLREIRVDCVSLVARAAVRDPEDVTQPQRFILRKGERERVVVCKRDNNYEREEDVTMATDIDARVGAGRRRQGSGAERLSGGSRARLRSAIELLEVMVIRGWRRLRAGW
jgi:hypothetical protein